jgi:integrase
MKLVFARPRFSSLTFAVFVGLNPRADQLVELRDQQMPLTDLKIRQAKPTTSLKKLSDGGGLQLWITPAGGKVWKLAYRFGGKQKTLTIGDYELFGLQDARERRTTAKRALAVGKDPAALKQEEKRAVIDANANTFDAIAAELIEKKRRERVSENTLGKVQWMHGMASADVGTRPIADITPPEILKILQKVEKRGTIETANRLRSVIGEVFRYAIATGRATFDHTQALKGAIARPVVRHRAAIVDPIEVGALLRAVDGFKGQMTTRSALKLMAYLFPRPGELRLAQWAEFDLAGAVWTIPAERMKMRREHRVPLPLQALTILADLKAASSGGALVFPGYGMSGGVGRSVAPRPMSEGTMIVALRRMGYSSDEMVPHGFRSIASTLLNESGHFAPDVIEAALAHQDADAVRRAYNRATFWQERVRMAQWWGDHLDMLRDGAQVIRLARA